MSYVFFYLQGTNVIELPDVTASRVSQGPGFSTVVSLPTSGQNGSAVRINGGTLIEQDSLSSNSKEENGAAANDSRGFNYFFIKTFFETFSAHSVIKLSKSEIALRFEQSHAALSFFFFR